MVHRFIFRSLLFALPLLLIIGSAEWLMWKSGEDLTNAEVIALQAGKKPALIFQRGIISQQFNVYKCAGINQYRPQILVAGSSRVMKFRDFEFHPFEQNFYNAGGILQNSNDITGMVDLMVSGKLHTPKCLILGIDPWWFKSDYADYPTWMSETTYMSDHASSFKAHIWGIRWLISNITDIKWRNIIKENDYIGYYAKVKKGGFRKDGSKSIEKKILDRFQVTPVFQEREDPPIFERIQKCQTVRYSKSSIDTTVLEHIKLAMDKLRAKGVEIIIYFPPFTDQSFALLEKSEPLKNWWTYYKKNVFDELNSRSAGAIQAEHPADYGLTDAVFIDGHHPGEIFQAIQLVHFLKSDNYRGSRLSSVDINYLEDRIKKIKMPALTFDPYTQK